MNIVNYVKYSDTGEVLMTGAMPDTMLADQEGNFIEGTARCGLDRIVDGKVVALPERPGPFFYFDYAAGIWELDTNLAWTAIRSRRDALIASADWTTLPDSPLTPEQRTAWVEYRQALRDITEQPDPSNIVWPSKPS